MLTRRIPSTASKQVRLPSRIEFSSIDHFIDDVRREGIRRVHLDIFEEPRQSELSFVYYVGLDCVVTARDATGETTYEYIHRVSVVTETEPHCTDPNAWALARKRLEELEDRLRAAGFDVRHGRVAEPRSTTH
ncbi:hypothetical protein [Alicyclobacillus sp.]|uniref:hypothetical protein n=1 Tax=Alicyclobacillus sp. TaxID=61169 RepID=UPI0025BE0EEA|nr:hypothetical protein [Alicyclobacillus sp.]MCL6517093.1 hypothetical protein [Alicyclobacillus sp.]